jgi:hypothetical protein
LIEDREKRREKHHRAAKRGEDSGATHAGMKFDDTHDGGEGDIEVSNYGQKMPNTLMGEMMGGGLDAPLMPIHFQYNFLNREDIPLHNEKFSKPSILLDA